MIKELTKKIFLNWFLRMMEMLVIYMPTQEDGSKISYSGKMDAETDW